MSVSSMKLVGVEFHQSGGNRQFRKAQLHGVNRRSCYPQVNQAESANSERIRKGTWGLVVSQLGFLNNSNRRKQRKQSRLCFLRFLCFVLLKFKTRHPLAPRPSAR